MEENPGGMASAFLAFVAQQEYAAMVYLGKIVNPQTGKSERNLEVARFTIDILGMLEEKTRGNLTPEEDRFLQKVLANLRLNFVDESGRQEEPAYPEADEKKAEKPAGAADEE